MSAAGRYRTDAVGALGLAAPDRFSYIDDQSWASSHGWRHMRRGM
jgi:hypothetical protein